MRLVASLKDLRGGSTGDVPPIWRRLRATGEWLDVRIRDQNARGTSNVGHSDVTARRNKRLVCVVAAQRATTPISSSALHAEPLVERCPQAIRFLALPSVYGFTVDGDYVDVWFDEALLIK